MSLAHLILSLIVFVAAVFALPARAQSAEDETCANQVLVVPPSMNDPLYSTWLVDYAKDALTSALQNECWDFVDNETAREELSFVGFDAYNRRIAKQYGPRQIDILKGRVDFNKVLFMEVRKGAQPQLVLRLYSIEANPKAPLKLSRKFLVSITNQDIKSHRSPFLLRWAAFFVPNSVTLGTTQTTILMDPAADHEEVSTKVKSDIPTVLASISIGQVPHPDAYRMWDGALSATPNLMLFSVNQTTLLRKKPEYAVGKAQSLRELHIQTFGGCGTIDGTASFFWPLGTSYFTLGIGPCYYEERQEQEDFRRNTDWGVRFGIGHRVFVTKHLYAYIDSQSMFFSRRIYDNAYAHSNTITRSAVGLGWYIPDIATKFARTF